jgi:ribosome-associated heat shock protein Hsp15
MSTDIKENKIRLDKWLWAARFFKTRSLATDAINGGKVHLNQQRAKPAKELHLGDRLTIRTGVIERTVIVRALSRQRRPAVEATLLYEETAESVERREQAAELRRRAAVSRPIGSGRPTKKDRRTLIRLTQAKTFDDK